MTRRQHSESEKSSLREQICACLLFADLSNEQTDNVLEHTRTVNLAEGENLFEQGQSAHEFFLLDRGQIKLALCSADGNEKIIDLIAPGVTFGEAIMFSKQPVYPVSATAVMESAVFCFNAMVYTNILHQSTEACFAVMAKMSQRLHWQIAEIDRLTLHSATFRVVSYLLDQVPSTQLGVSEVRLDTPKHVIAARLSITPETLSRSFSKLHKEGLIDVHDNAVTLNDVGRLKQFVHGETL